MGLVGFLLPARTARRLSERKTPDRLRRRLYDIVRTLNHCFTKVKHNFFGASEKFPGPDEKKALQREDSVLYYAKFNKAIK